MNEADYLQDLAATGTPVSAADVIADPDTAKWDATCELLVAGLGLAGATATLRAAERGCRDIIAVDRFEGGGASQLSGGVVYAGGGTHVQREAGIEDTTDNLFAYLQHETSNVVSRETLRRFCEQSPEMIRWLEKYGAQFSGPLYPRKTSYPPNGYFLYYSGNENVPECVALAKPVPRGHRAKPTFKSKVIYGGVYLMHALLSAVGKTQGVQAWYRTSLRRLILDGTGRVVGAELWRLSPGSWAAWRHRFLHRLGKNVMLTMLGMTRSIWTAITDIERAHAKPIRVRVRSGVILAAGGFIHNPAMMRRAAPRYAGKVTPLGTMADDGSGIQLGLTAGAGIANMGTISAWRFINPPYDWSKGIVVSFEGKRLTNEEQYGARMGHAMFEQANGRALLIIDEHLMNCAKTEIAGGELLPHQKFPTLSRIKTAVSAPTVEQLAGQVGTSPGLLEAAVADYNDAIRAGRPDAFRKSDGMRTLLDKPPFYAIDITNIPKVAPLTAITVGGLQVDEDNGAVLSSDGRVIHGLYAAGRSANSIVSNFYVSGLSLADCVFSGWRAADGAVTGDVDVHSKKVIAASPAIAAAR
jgi:3-oxo-5alpha-steroid 4-dehydrogenase